MIKKIISGGQTVADQSKPNIAMQGIIT